MEHFQVKLFSAVNIDCYKFNYKYLSTNNNKKIVHIKIWTISFY